VDCHWIQLIEARQTSPHTLKSDPKWRRNRTRSIVPLWGQFHAPIAERWSAQLGPLQKVTMTPIRDCQWIWLAEALPTRHRGPQSDEHSSARRGLTIVPLWEPRRSAVAKVTNRSVHDCQEPLGPRKASQSYRRVDIVKVDMGTMVEALGAVEKWRRAHRAAKDFFESCFIF